MSNEQPERWIEIKCQPRPDLFNPRGDQIVTLGVYRETDSFCRSWGNVPIWFEYCDPPAPSQPPGAPED